VSGEAVRRAIEQAEPIIHTKASGPISYAGAGIAAVSAWGLQEWGAVIGIVLGIGTYLWNRKAKRAAIEADEAKKRWFEEHEP